MQTLVLNQDGVNKSKYVCRQFGSHHIVTRHCLTSEVACCDGTIFGINDHYPWYAIVFEVKERNRTTVLGRSAFTPTTVNQIDIRGMIGERTSDSPLNEVSGDRLSLAAVNKAPDRLGVISAAIAIPPGFSSRLNFQFRRFHGDLRSKK